jgi:hypothetical protein
MSRHYIFYVKLDKFLNSRDLCKTYPVMYNALRDIIMEYCMMIVPVCIQKIN